MTSAEAIPLRLAGPAEAAALQSVFARASFAEDTICQRLQIPQLVGLDFPAFKSRERQIDSDGLLEVLTRVFLFGSAVPRAALAAHLSERELAAFFAADLLRAWTASAAGEDAMYSPVRLAPIRASEVAARDLFVAGDRTDHPDGSTFAAFADIVFPAHTPLTRQFLTLLPATRPKTVLELCAGSAIAALALASAGSRCTAADIADRSAHFARFNAWLNSCPVDVVCGDLYAPVSGAFDCVIVHPPYVPSISQRLTYRDGGETGDEIVRGTIAGLPAHLNVNGTFHMLCLGMDTAEARFEDRIREWLGPSHAEFDVIFALDSTTPTEEIATRLSGPFGGTTEGMLRWRDLFSRLHVKEFVYGATVVRRFDPRAGEPVTRRVLMTSDTTAASFDWLLRWFDRLREPGAEARALDVKPTLAPGATLEVRHRSEGRGFTPEVFHLENNGRPFLARLRIETWLAGFLSELDGEHTAREILDRARARGRVPDTFTDAELPTLLSYLGERNCIVL